MNCSRAWLKPRHVAFCTYLSVCVVGVTGFLLLPGSLQADPPAGRSAFDYAGLEPGPFTEAPKDLQLTPEGEHQSEALAAFVEGFIAEDEANPDVALERYQAVLALDPGYVELSAKVAAEFERRGQTAEAINVLKDAAKAAPRSSLPRLFLSQLYLRSLKRPETAEKYALEAVSIEPANPASLRTLLDVYISNGDRAKAEQAIDRAAKNPVNTSEYWLELAQLAARLYLTDDQNPPTPDRVAKLNQILKRASSLVGDDVVGLTRLADYYVLSRQVNEAIPLYLHAVALRPDSSDPLIAATRDKLARSFRLIGSKDQAINILADLAEKNPERFETHVLLGELYKESGDYDKALAAFEKSLELDDSDPGAWLRIADVCLRIFSQSKDPAYCERAIAKLQQAREKFPDSALVTYSLAMAYSQAKRHAEALSEFAKTEEEFEESQPDMLNGSFYLAYGAAAEQASNYEKAAEMLKKAIDLDPTSAEAMNYLGFMWIDRGENLDEAGALVQRALAQDPGNPAYLDSLGWFYFQKGEYEKALAELLKAAEALNPEDPIVFDHVADTYSKLGNVAQAMAYWQKALALDPTNKVISDKMEKAKQKVTSAPAGAVTK